MQKDMVITEFLISRHQRDVISLVAYLTAICIKGMSQSISLRVEDYLKLQCI